VSDDVCAHTTSIDLLECWVPRSLECKPDIFRVTTYRASLLMSFSIADTKRDEYQRVKTSTLITSQETPSIAIICK
jgi:hypothetical protein